VQKASEAAVKYIGRARVNPKARLGWPVHLEGCTVRRGASIGGYSYVRPGTTVGIGVQIGRYCAIASGCDIGPAEHPTDWLSNHDFQYTKNFFKEVEGFRSFARRPFEQPAAPPIGHDVWIGPNVVIRRGVTVGHGAIIGAGSFVNRDIAPYTIVKGSPARPLRPRFPDAIIEELLELEWWTLDAPALDGVPFDDIARAIAAVRALKAG